MMKTERVIKTFKEIMVSLGFKDIEVKPGDPKDYDCEGVFQVGFNGRNGFAMDLDIVPGEITYTIPKSVLNKRSRKVKDKGFVITGYKPTSYRYDEPPDVEEFTIGEEMRLMSAFNTVIKFYVEQLINNHWESASYEEIAEEEEKIEEEIRRHDKESGESSGT